MSLFKGTYYFIGDSTTYFNIKGLTIDMDRAALSRKMYITYKSRINASERLKKTNSFIQGINIYYSLFLTALSIFNVSSGTTKLSLVITVYSVVVTVTIVFLAAQNYGERAKSLKNNYVAISKLCNRIQSDIQEDDIQKISDEYNKLIDSSENHTEYDYSKACMGISNERHSLSVRHKIIYYTTYYGSILLKIFLIIFPFLLKYFVELLEWLITV